jgi:hypothetical protein
MRVFLWPTCLIVAASCSSSHVGETGMASLSTNGRAAPTVSAWAYSSGDFLLGPDGTRAYVPWTIMLGSVPDGTSCSSGTGRGSLQHDASSWLVSIDIDVPYTDGADTAALAQLQPGTIPIRQVDSLTRVDAIVADVQVFDGGLDLDLLAAGTLTITSFSDEGIEGRFDATGSGATKTATATFSASRCTF